MDIKQRPVITRQFFKVMMSGFHQKLNLPPAVSKDLEKFKSETVIIESCLGRWKMGLSRNCENGLICFEQGWPQFVHRHAMGREEFIVFEPTAQHLHFNAYVFDSSGCEKEFDVETKKVKLQELAKTPNPTAEDQEAPCFERTMLPQHATKSSTVRIPREFMRLNNLGKQRRAVLRDCRGRAWGVNLAKTGEDRVHQRMGSGWLAFYASNALKDGDTCVFKLVRRNLTPTTIVFDVQIISPDSPPTLLY